MANNTATDVQAAPKAVQDIYKAWDIFCAWYEEEANHERGKKPTQWSKNVTNWRKFGQYPRPASILKAIEETGVAAISIQFYWDETK